VVRLTGSVPLCVVTQSPRCQGDGLERVDRPPQFRPDRIMEEKTAEMSFTATVRKVQARAGLVARRWA
jgi:hypothetical protein